MNIVMNSNDGFIELQGTAEGESFSDQELTTMLSLARTGIRQIFKLQKQA
jgi:ribonuclease PH